MCSSTRFILGPLLFLLYVNDLPNASKILDPTTFAVNTNLSLSNCNIPVLFATANSELSKISQCFLANKLYLNVTKTECSFFHKTSTKDDIPLKLPKFQINNYNIERSPSVKFLGVLLDENFSRKDHIKYTKNKIYENIGILYKTRDYLSKQSLLSSLPHLRVALSLHVWEVVNRKNLTIFKGCHYSRFGIIIFLKFLENWNKEFKLGPRHFNFSRTGNYITSCTLVI